MAKKVAFKVLIGVVLVAALVGAFLLYAYVSGTKRHLRIRFDYARTLFSAGQYEKALEVFQSIEERAPRYVSVAGYDVCYYIATSHKQLGNIEEARRVYRTSINKGLSTASYLPLGFLELDTGKYSESIGLFEQALRKKAIQRDPFKTAVAHEGLFYGRACLHERDRALQHLADAFDQLLKLKDTHVPGLGTGQDYALMNLYAYTRTPPGGVKAAWRQWIEGDPEYQRLLEHYKQAFQYYEHEQELIDVLGTEE